MSLTFDPVEHVYRWHGQRVPGVTSILKPLTDYGSVPASVLQAASEFGKAVHLACELDDLGELDVYALDDALAPYLAGWRKFCADTSASWAIGNIEHPLYNESLRYAGTPDRIGVVNDKLSVVDIKTTAALYPSVGPQLAAYAHAYNPIGAKAMQRIAVQLKDDGTYTAKTYTDPTDWPLFCSLLTVRNWCASHNINPNFKG